MFKEGEMVLKSEEHSYSKICKLIMSKLTVTHDLNFRGELANMLAKKLPLTHESGLNQHGSFNVENTTIIESNVEPSKAKGETSDYRNYRSFWNI